MKSLLFDLKGIKEPGRISALLNGRIRDVKLTELGDGDLKQLYDQKCPHLILTPAGRKHYFPDDKQIEVTELNLPGQVERKGSKKAAKK